MKTRILFTAISITLLFSACSDNPEKAVQKAPEAPPEAVTGSSAFFKMYAAARGGWSVDLQPLKLVSIHLPQVKAEPGKAGAWQATFVSPSVSSLKDVFEGEAPSRNVVPWSKYWFDLSSRSDETAALAECTDSETQIHAMDRSKGISPPRVFSPTRASLEF